MITYDAEATAFLGFLIGNLYEGQDAPHGFRLRDALSAGKLLDFFGYFIRNIQGELLHDLSSARVRI